MVTASRAASSTGVTVPPARSDSTRSTSGAAQLLEDLLLALAEELGQDAVDDDGRHAHRRLLADPVTSSSVSFTGISSGVHTATSPVWRASERMSSIQSVWLRISPTLTRSLMACGAASCPMMWPLAGASTTTMS